MEGDVPRIEEVRGDTLIDCLHKMLTHKEGEDTRIIILPRDIIAMVKAPKEGIELVSQIISEVFSSQTPTEALTSVESILERVVSEGEENSNDTVKDLTPYIVETVLSVRGNLGQIERAVVIPAWWAEDGEKVYLKVQNDKITIYKREK